jgi:hypothetical protein
MPGDVLLAKELHQVSKHDIVLVLEVRMLGMGAMEEARVVMRLRRLLVWGIFQWRIVKDSWQSLRALAVEMEKGERIKLILAGQVVASFGWILPILCCLITQPFRLMVDGERLSTLINMGLVEVLVALFRSLLKT